MTNDPMKFAIELAENARDNDEIPIGCVIVDNNNKFISYASNAINRNHDPTAHAEIIAIRKACKKLKTTKLLNLSIYVTLEPCQMCESAILNVGIKKIFFGAYSNNLKIQNYKLKNYLSNRRNYEIFGGFSEEYCSKLIINFFKKKDS